jgi:hypothetical protein
MKDMDSSEVSSISKLKRRPNNHWEIKIPNKTETITNIGIILKQYEKSPVFGIHPHGHTTSMLPPEQQGRGRSGGSRLVWD